MVTQRDPNLVEKKILVEVLKGLDVFKDVAPTNPDPDTEGPD